MAAGEKKRKLYELVEVEEATEESTGSQDDEFLSLEDVAKRFSVSPRTIRRWVAERGMPGYILGGLYRFDWSEVRQWMRENRAGG